MSRDKDHEYSSIEKALLADEVVTEKQLVRAARIQELLEEPKQLTDVLIDLGYAKRHQITEVITKHGSNIRLGEMLLEQGIVTKAVLDKALALQMEQKIRLGEALIEIGAINERTLLQNIAYQNHVAFIEPSFSMLDTQLLKEVAPTYLRQNRFLPFSRNDEGRVLVIVAELNDERATEACNELYQGFFEMALGPEEAIKSTINELEKYKNVIASQQEEKIAEEEDSTVQLVNHLLNQAIEEAASDIHLEPMPERVRVRYRIDGVLVYKTDIPLDLLPRVVSRIKIMAECNITEHQRHQGGRILYAHQGKEIDLRLSIYVTVHGESVVMRILNKDMALVTLDELGMTPTMLERFREDVLDPPTGVVLITGPTGSGKTTTLYSGLDYCNDVACKIITAEDPVEFTIDGIVQCSIDTKVGRSFESTLREIVRQDPDIIVMGEIRDKTTAAVAIQAALTGHKVYSTFHTEDTIGGLLRLIDMDIETFLISSTVISVLAQRLLRRICPKCSEPYIPNHKEINALGLNMSEVREYEYKKGRGCKHCSYTGYRGRVGAYELLILNEPVKEAILRKKTAHEIREISIETTQLISMREDAVGKVIHGVTTFEEVLKHTPRMFKMRSIQQIMNLCQ